MLDSYAASSELRALFAQAWCGPAMFEHGQPTLIAKLPKTCNNGFDVEVYCTATPACFYEIKAVSGAVEMVGLTLKTHSGMARFAMEFAKLATEGLLDVRTAEANAEKESEHA